MPFLQRLRSQISFSVRLFSYDAFPRRNTYPALLAFSNPPYCKSATIEIYLPIFWWLRAWCSASPPLSGQRGWWLLVVDAIYYHSPRCWQTGLSFVKIWILEIYISKTLQLCSCLSNKKVMATEHRFQCKKMNREQICWNEKIQTLFFCVFLMISNSSCKLRRKCLNLLIRLP